MTMPNTNPSDLDREALKAALGAWTWQMSYTSGEIEENLQSAVQAYLEALSPASGVPEAEAVAWYTQRSDGTPRDLTAQKAVAARWREQGFVVCRLYASSPPVAAPSGEREALELIASLHIPDQPSAFGGDELEWAQRHVSNLRKIARDALAASPAINTANEAVKREREACAQVCEQLAATVLHPTQTITDRCAAAIRARTAPPSPIASEPKDAGSGEGQELSMAEENRALVDCCTDAAGNWCSSLTALRALHSRGYRIIRIAPSGAKRGESEK